MKCPAGLASINDVRRAHDDHEGCSAGYVYTLAGEVSVLFIGNSKNSQYLEPGRADGSTVQVTFARFYDDRPEEPVELAPFDRLYLKEPVGTTQTWQLFSASRLGDDRLMYPATKVLDLLDSAGVRYRQDVDFDLASGRVKW